MAGQHRRGLASARGLADRDDSGDAAGRSPGAGHGHSPARTQPRAGGPDRMAAPPPPQGWSPARARRQLRHPRRRLPGARRLAAAGVRRRRQPGPARGADRSPADLPHRLDSRADQRPARWPGPARLRRLSARHGYPQPPAHGGSGALMDTAPAAAAGPANPIQAPGTSESAWRAWPQLRQLPVANIADWASAVIVAAHLDDEVLGAGGIIARLARAGARLRVIAVTDGEASHPGHGDPAQLARTRMAERGEAMLALGAGAAEVFRLGMPDAGLAGRQDDIAAALQDLAAGFDACLAPWEGDMHADHEAVGQAARQAGGRAFFYPVWAWHWARPGDLRVPWPRAVRVPLAPGDAGRKRAAIGCFGSQLEPRPGSAGPVLAPGFVAHFTRDYEVLFPV